MSGAWSAFSERRAHSADTINLAATVLSVMAGDQHLALAAQQPTRIGTDTASPLRYPRLPFRIQSLSDAISSRSTAWSCCRCRMISRLLLGDRVEFFQSTGILLEPAQAVAHLVEGLLEQVAHGSTARMPAKNESACSFTRLRLASRSLQCMQGIWTSMP